MNGISETQQIIQDTRIMTLMKTVIFVVKLVRVSPIFVVVLVGLQHQTMCGIAAVLQHVHGTALEGQHQQQQEAIDALMPCLACRGPDNHDIVHVRVLHSLPLHYSSSSPSAVQRMSRSPSPWQRPCFAYKAPRPPPPCHCGSTATCSATTARYIAADVHAPTTVRVHHPSTGECFGGLDTQGGNDGVALLTALHQRGDGDIGSLLSAFRGPWALLFWQQHQRRLWFGRDVLGPCGETRTRSSSLPSPPSSLPSPPSS